MAGKRNTQHDSSSLNEYLDAINKLNPQLKTLLAHLGNITGNPANQYTEDCKKDAAAGAKKTRCVTRKVCTPRRRTGMASCEQEVQAVTNSGKIVYGVVRENGQLDVKGHVGEVNEDLLGLDLDVVNGGKPRRPRKKCVTMSNEVTEHIL
ncbi:ORF-114 [Teiidae poxvirus 1]|nr:ORF-114 [Teiidae poxvirus 1]